LQIKKIKSSNSNTEKFCKIATFLFPIFLIIFLVSQKFLFGAINEDYINFTKEDGPAEYSTAIFYLLSFVFSVIIGFMFIKQKKNLFALLYLLFSAIFFFIAFEEISWGQRILGIDTLEFFSENSQNETNFHNLPIFHLYQNYLFFIVGIIGSFAWLILKKFNNLKMKSFKKFFIPQPHFMSYFLPAMLFNGMILIPSYIPKSANGLFFNFFGRTDNEVTEFLLSMGIFLFLISKIILWYNLKSQSNLAKLPSKKIKSQN